MLYNLKPAAVRMVTDFKSKKRRQGIEFFHFIYSFILLCKWRQTTVYKWQPCYVLCVLVRDTVSITAIAILIA